MVTEQAEKAPERMSESSEQESERTTIFYFDDRTSDKLPPGYYEMSTYANTISLLCEMDYQWAVCFFTLEPDKTYEDLTLLLHVFLIWDLYCSKSLFWR